MKNKLYVLVDKTLDPIYGAVQGGHVVAEWLIENYNFNKKWEKAEWDWNNDYLIYLSVDIKTWYEEIRRFDPGKFQWTWFEEPDLDNKMTAIAIYANDFPHSIIKKLNNEKLLEMENK